ncbi:RagB/SusD domain protein [Pseudopedobacter saltans DSM 12145]|uniref:RagB/SusD domain protein n=1 Tax=Pseudopedobacter saltans (strain ATCC 51119 / DSM 12145 / JCM 21818 / CCUG 39354 / LMG 10337 / NBRC 100064 / NCIMB 13643) TaxID=762903 RepID=F0S6T1_PSESL|nr:RagB/SusD family nutrient uptake outer membrane protein [Pseudopedobacter saltans]ADY52191.1 RagB/SusD domain protein [Pseudopedobacter saltans DSM 12145]
MKKLNKTLFCLLTTGVMLLTSCKNYLDVSSELSDNLTINGVFENVEYTKRWHANTYNCIIEYSKNASSADAMSNPWSAISGELACNFARNTMVTGYTPANAGYHRWATQYKYIRQALIFLEKAHAIGSGSGNNVLPEYEILRMKDEAKFLIAYSYFTLLELYGPVPLVTEIANPEDKDIDYARAPMDDVINYIDGLLADVIDAGRLPATISKNDSNFNTGEMVKPTLVIVRALRAKLWVYAASKLFNGGFPESLSIVNKDGTRLFPDYNADKWQTAKKRLEEFLDYAHSMGHKLYAEYYSNTTDINPHASVYQVFQKYNDEIIWATAYNDYSNPNNQERRSNPVDLYASPTNFANISVSQESVDAFFMNNGLTIYDQGSGYKENGFTTVNNPTHVNNNPDPNIFNMYANREARFYAAIGYNGKSWHIHANEHNNPGGVYYQWYGRGKASGIAGGENWPRAGYLFYKFKHRRIAQGVTSINVAGAPGTPFTVYTSWSRPSILLRLADFYLYYAEVLNEIDPNDPRIIAYIDKVRERAGIPGYAELATNGTKTGVIGNKQEQFKAIVQERHVEFLGEGQRWFDMRRWMICDPAGANQPDKGGVDGDMTRMTGMNMNGFDNVKLKIGSTETTTKPIGDPDSFFQRTKLEGRRWAKEYYWYPVPQNEINKSRGHLLVQNPLWPVVLTE